MSQPDLEKRELARDHIESVVRDLANDERVIAFSEKEQKAIVRRIDLRLVVTLGCLYCISLLDRTNLGAASVAGYVLSANHIPFSSRSNRIIECRRNWA